MKRPLTRAALVAVVFSFLGALTAGARDGGVASALRADLPVRLSDAEFWDLSERFSEPGGTFHSDNFVSNEAWFQHVIPDLVTRVKPGGVYLGVGPEQNFTYMVAVRPRMAFIIDIRRGNLHEHLLYKALFELSADRADFVSRLFCRERPASLKTTSTVEEIFAAVSAAPRSRDIFTRNLKTVGDWLTTHHGFKLHADDLPGIEYVYQAMYDGGPEIGYVLNNAFGGRGVGSPGYGGLMAEDDGRGTQRSYLVSEENFRWLKDLETKNLVVPVVGNFGGPKALRAVASYVRAQGGVVSAFYVSNVEMYLNQDGIWNNFCQSAATLPLDASSTFIRSVRGGGLRDAGPGGFESRLATIGTDVKACGGRP